jgi:hypothetical protein
MEVSLSKESETPTSQECWALLERIEACAGLRRAPRLREFLDYVARRSLRDGCIQIHEQEIGTAVFGRPETYDTSVDNIVRANATELRKRIETYFESEGSEESLIVEIPRGSYVPVFRYRPAPATPIQAGDTEAPLAEVSRAIPAARRVPLPWLIVGLVIVALSAGCISLWVQNRAMYSSLYPWKDEPAVSAFWGSFLGNQKDTDLVLADASYSLVQDLANKSFNLDDYLSRNYMSQLQDPDPRMAAALARISNWGLGSPSEVEVAQRILALDPAHQRIHLYFARKYMPDLIARDNVILFGSRFGNPWAELFESRMNFVFNPQNPNQIINRVPAKGEPATYEYTASGAFGYCIVAYLPTPDHNSSALLVQGSSGEPTQAAGDFLLTESRMADFRKMVGASKFPYFELLLKTSWVKGTPINSTIVAYRTYAGSN